MGSRLPKDGFIYSDDILKEDNTYGRLRLTYTSAGECPIPNSSGNLSVVYDMICDSNAK